MADRKSGPDKHAPEAKQRIFDTATRLFARQGYAATGVRQIAREAEVNLAMINYFYQSKVGLLKAILADFFSNLKTEARRVIEGDPSPEEGLRQIIHTLARFYRDNIDAVMIALTEMNRDTPEVAEFKAEQVKVLPQMMEPYYRALIGPVMADKFKTPVFGPMMVLMIVSHYLFRPVIERTGLVEFNDEFYRDYPDMVANLVLYGLTNPDHWRFDDERGDKSGA